jgi:hypothetical protein
MVTPAVEDFFVNLNISRLFRGSSDFRLPTNTVQLKVNGTCGALWSVSKGLSEFTACWKERKQSNRHQITLEKLHNPKKKCFNSDEEEKNSNFQFVHSQILD